MTAEPIAKVFSRVETKIEEIEYKFYTGKEDGDLFDEMNCGSNRNPSKVLKKGRTALEEQVLVRFTVIID